MQIICTSFQTDNHVSTSLLRFLQAGCPSCCPTNGIKALKLTQQLLLMIYRTDGDVFVFQQHNALACHAQSATELLCNEAPIR